MKYLCLWVLLWPATTTPQAQSTSADELEIRAAMILNLTKFIEWPPWKIDHSHPDFVICLLGSDPLAVNLESVLKNRQVENKPVLFKRLSSADAAAGCHILYLGIGARRNFAVIAPGLAKDTVLTMSDKSNSENQSQIIGLPTTDEHVRIDVNLSAAKRSGLILSSKLLRLATVTP